jgi:tetratricopeptide (TPR) repeat protein
MKIRLFVQIAASLAVGIFFSFSAAGQSAAEWDAYKAAHGIDPSVTYNDWSAQQNSSSAAPSIPAGPTPQQQMQLQGAQMIGTAIGKSLGQMLFGPPQVDPAQQAAQLAAQQAQQQRQLAANQLNNSGIYLLKQKDYIGAINEFQKALGQTPNDPNILHNLALAKQRIKDTAVAAQNSGALSQLLGDAPANAGNFDFDQLTHSSGANPNASALNLVNLDANTVDLRDHITALNSLNANNDPNTVDFRGLPKDSNMTEEEKQNLNQQALQQQVSQQFDQIVSGGSYAVNFSGLGKTKSATPSTEPADVQQTLQTLDEVLDNKNTKSDEEKSNEEFFKQEDPAWKELMRQITSKLPKQLPNTNNSIGVLGIRG